MHRARTTRLRLTAAVAVALATTPLGTLTVPGTATAAVARETAAEETFPFARQPDVTSAGLTGFPVDGATQHRGAPGADVVVASDPTATGPFAPAHTLPLRTDSTRFKTLF
ncbi:hypothetical protein GCM10010282_35800 [Streptomyces roseolus]|nr:hypothetical protein GCM10010282_35800 [Streptomyces roseolus]